MFDLQLTRSLVLQHKESLLGSVYIMKRARARPPSSMIQHPRIVDMQDYRESEEKLPSDLLEEIAKFLPLASLCRCKVSKNWNRFISHPDFASRHARASPAEEHVLVSERDVALQISSHVYNRT